MSRIAPLDSESSGSSGEDVDNTSIPTPPSATPRYSSREPSLPAPSSSVPAPPPASIRRSARTTRGTVVEVMVPRRNEPPLPPTSLQQPTKALDGEWTVADVRVSSQ